MGAWSGRFLLCVSLDRAILNVAKFQIGSLHDERSAEDCARACHETSSMWPQRSSYITPNNVVLL
jgi:hypothetical protein